jgi:N4-gp56 family major capsid protein
VASQNYASAVLSKIDERFYLESKTAGVINKGLLLEFAGLNSVTIYNVNTVPETDYIRSGTDRFGTLVELGNGVQTFTLSQDKAFTFSVDRGNLEDSQMVTEANKAVKRQIREVSIPNTDIYRLATLQAYAVANSQSATAALTTSNAYNKFLGQNDAMTDALVPEDGRWCFMTPATYSLLKQDSTFNKACDTAYQDLKKGVIGMVDGVMLVKVPSTYLPANTGYLFVHEETLVSPVKFNSVRVLTEQRGIDGAVAEGRRYYDAFIPTNKGKAIRAHMTA